LHARGGDNDAFGGLLFLFLLLSFLFLQFDDTGEKNEDFKESCELHSIRGHNIRIGYLLFSINGRKRMGI